MKWTNVDVDGGAGWKARESLKRMIVCEKVVKTFSFICWET